MRRRNPSAMGLLTPLTTAMPRRSLFAMVLTLAPLAVPAQTASNTPAALFAGTVGRVLSLLQPATNGPTATFTTTFKVLEARGALKPLAGQQLDLAFQVPDHIKVTADVAGQRIQAARDGQEIWVYEPGKKFGLIGSADVPRFTGYAYSRENNNLGPLKLPIAEHLPLLPIFADVQPLPDENVNGAPCKVLDATPKPEAVTSFNLMKFNLRVWVRESDRLPLRIAYRDPKETELVVELVNPAFHTNFPGTNWTFHSQPDDHIERVARGHLARFVSLAMDKLTGNRIPTLRAGNGQREVVAREGKGRLEKMDGTRVLFLKGTPEEMGRQHGTLLNKEVRDVAQQILYGVGVGSSFEKGRWFFGEIEEAQRRLEPYMDRRYLREMDALAEASGLAVQEARLANFFPELFHCSGFAIFGKATRGGRMYHGRILDYLRGMGLEQNAVVIVMQPDQANAWVNIGYAGFIGSVTAMNEKHLAIGEMGGRGEGHWDGKPMAELVREVMERANTLDEAVAIMRKGPRTCEYYYVISDAKAKRAVGIAATPTKFEVVKHGESHPQLPFAIPDAVLMSAGDRYEELVRRVKAGYGTFDAQSAQDLMKRPVCMTSNIHSVLFEPESLDFWVANADSQNPAAHTRYTQYNLARLLEPEKEP